MLVARKATQSSSTYVCTHVLYKSLFMTSKFKLFSDMHKRITWYQGCHGYNAFCLDWKERDESDLHICFEDVITTTLISVYGFNTNLSIKATGWDSAAWLYQECLVRSRKKMRARQEQLWALRKWDMRSIGSLSLSPNVLSTIFGKNEATKALHIARKLPLLVQVKLPLLVREQVEEFWERFKS